MSGDNKHGSNAYPKIPKGTGPKFIVYQKNRANPSNFGLAFVAAGLSLVVAASTLGQLYISSLQAELAAYLASANISTQSRNVSIVLEEIKNVRATESDIVVFVSLGIVISLVLTAHLLSLGPDQDIWSFRTKYLVVCIIAPYALGWTEAALYLLTGSRPKILMPTLLGFLVAFGVLYTWTKSD